MAELRAKRSQPPAPSIRDVAKHAGVSIATVSRALNNNGSLSSVLKRRVMRAIDQLEYRPNAAAQRLRSGRTRTIGLILRTLDNNNFATLWKAVVGVAYRNKYDVVVMTSESDPRKEHDCIDVLMRHDVDGIVAFVANENDHAFARIRSVPVVMVEGSPMDIEADEVFCENFEGARQAVSYLLQLGHSDIEILGGFAERTATRDRVRGYEAAYRDHGIAVDPGRIHFGPRLSDEFLTRIRKRLQSKRRPTALFAATSFLTLETLTLLRELELRVPDDISLVGFDSGSIANLVTPALSTVERNIHQLGTTAAQMLLDRIDGAPDAPRRRTALPTSLIIRRSCARRA